MAEIMKERSEPETRFRQSQKALVLRSSLAEPRVPKDYRSSFKASTFLPICEQQIIQGGNLKITQKFDAFHAGKEGKSIIFICVFDR